MYSEYLYGALGLCLRGCWGLGAQKLELGTGWFEACAFLLVVILSLSSCFPNNMVPFFLFPLVILCLCFFCSFVFLFLTSIVIWTNGELGFKGLSWSGEVGCVKGGLLGIGGSKAKVGDWRF